MVPSDTPLLPFATGHASPERSAHSSVATQPLYEIRFEDRVGGHCRMLTKTGEDVHVIDTRVASPVPEVVARWPEKVRYSNSRLSSSGSLVTNQAIVQFSPTCAISFDSAYREWGSECMVMARTREEASEAHAVLVKVFGAPPSRSDQRMPVFRILALEDQRVRAHRTTMARCPSLTKETMDLSYGDGFHQWAEHLISIFETSPSSLTLLQGPPGTGKTTFLRWLIGQAQEAADFYFVPVTCIDLLSNPNLTDFWLKECAFSNRPKVLLIEDAETLLMQRGHSNGHWVGNLLNITDGIMGDALRFHVVCTMNCPFTDIDPALLRRGRLAASWTFRPLGRENAEKLARLLGKNCPDGTSFTLADLHSPPVCGDLKNPGAIGFHAVE
jgi:hypothetical protein